MLKRICIPKLMYLVLPVILLLLSACATQEDIPAGSSEAPTGIPTSTATNTPMGTPLPAPSEVPTDSPEPTEEEPMEVQPTETEERPDITITLPEGDAERGKKLALKWRCITCHVTNTVAPGFGTETGLPLLMTRAEMHIADAAYTGFASTAEEYIVEAIIDPSVYISEGEWEYEMDDIYDVELSEKDLADIIAWLLTLE